MSILYNGIAEAEVINKETGEVLALKIKSSVNVMHKHPINSKLKRTTYMEQFEKILNLTKTQQTLLFEILKNVDKYNVLIKTFKDIAVNITNDDSRLSKEVKALKEHGFIAKIEKVHMLNPFYVLPVYEKLEPEKYWMLQQLWNLYNVDKDTYWETMESDIENVINYSKPKAKYIKIQKKFYEAPNEK